MTLRRHALAWYSSCQPCGGGSVVKTTRPTSLVRSEIDVIASTPRAPASHGHRLIQLHRHLHLLLLHGVKKLQRRARRIASACCPPWYHDPMIKACQDHYVCTPMRESASQHLMRPSEFRAQALLWAAEKLA